MEKADISFLPELSKLSLPSTPKSNEMVSVLSKQKETLFHRKVRWALSSPISDWLRRCDEMSRHAVSQSEVRSEVYLTVCYSHRKQSLSFRLSFYFALPFSPAGTVSRLSRRISTSNLSLFTASCAPGRNRLYSRYSRRRDSA